MRQRLAALGRRVENVRQQSLLELERLFGQCIPPHLLSQAPTKAPTAARARLPSPAHVLGLPLVGAQSGLPLPGGGPPDPGSVHFARWRLDRCGHGPGRLRLPLESLQRPGQAVAARVEQFLLEARQLWHGLAQTPAETALFAAEMVEARAR